MQIITDRLVLYVATPAILASELAFLKDSTQRETFEQALCAQTASWPPLYNDLNTCTYALERISQNPDKRGWWSWYILLKRELEIPLLVGLAGFHGPPDADGSAEIGYSVVEEYQRRGIASETVMALTDWAFSHEDVSRVIITTLDTPELVPSSKVAQKSGYSFVGKKPSEEGILLVYELTRDDYAKQKTHERESQ